MKDTLKEQFQTSEIYTKCTSAYISTTNLNSFNKENKTVLIVGDKESLKHPDSCGFEKLSLNVQL